MRRRDPLTVRLDEMSAPLDSPPPASLLAMVRRRRRVRQARQAAGVLLVLLALTPLAWVLRNGPESTPIVEHPDVSKPASPQREVAIGAPDDAFLHHLIALNRGADTGEIVLPECPGGRTPRTLRVLDTLNAQAALEHL
ncbi:MAG: hypothetical protein KJZ65_13055 [Phycisphaerales bacterium]|nr:hypothetical protein [Phycisphaerales bacterium]